MERSGMTCKESGRTVVARGDSLKEKTALKLALESQQPFLIDGMQFKPSCQDKSHYDIYTNGRHVGSAIVHHQNDDPYFFAIFAGIEDVKIFSQNPIPENELAP